MYCKDMKLTRSASEQNVYFSYVCLINEIKPNLVDPETAQKRLSLHLPDADNEEDDEDHIKVERSKALHELVESYRKEEDPHPIFKKTSEDIPPTPVATTSGEDNLTPNIEENCIIEKPNILKLTKMKWLTEDQDGAPDSSSPSISPASSTCSFCSRESETHLQQNSSYNDKYLSTIIRLDKEHNMFGLSNIAIVGSKASKRTRKDDKAVFHQTAIVQLCCGKICCKHRSKTALPSSLKCNGCSGCCAGPSCTSCYPCGPIRGRPCRELPCKPSLFCCKPKCSPKVTCLNSSCCTDCNTSYGIKIKLNKKPKYEPSPIEITPRSSCILQKPLAARTCTHWPPCCPASSCCPYLLPCYWPARRGAPCNTPDRCFHNPPCRPPRRARGPPEDLCPQLADGGCDNNEAKCSNKSCPGNNPDMKAQMETRFHPKSAPLSKTNTPSTHSSPSPPSSPPKH